MAEAYEINIAPHNYYSHLADLHSLHLCAVLPNVRIMEIDVDDVAWKGSLVTKAPVIKDGHIFLPEGPGWGADINEAYRAIRHGPVGVPDAYLPASIRSRCHIETAFCPFRSRWAPSQTAKATAVS